MNYNELSRRGLIKLNGDYDKASKGKLKDYLESGVNEYEGVKPYETILDKMEDSIDKIKESSSGVVNDAIVKRTTKIMDKMMKNITKEIDRIQEVIDEKTDDDSYSDNPEEEEVESEEDEE